MALSNERKYCVKCKKAVKITEMFLVCGLWCRKSFHNYCVGLSINEAHAVKWSKGRIKFHCQACENRLGMEVYGEEETYEPKKLQDCVTGYLVELVQNILKLTNKLSNDSSVINTKLDTVLSSNARLEESLFQSPRCFEKRTEETSYDHEYVPSDSIKRISEISEQNDGTDLHYQSHALDIQQTDNWLHNANDFGAQVTDGDQQNVAEGCCSNGPEALEVPDVHDSTHDPLRIDQVWTQEWEMPESPNSMKDPLCIDNEDCLSSEEIPEPITVKIEKTGDQEDEEAVREDDLHELKCEVVSITSGSESQSAGPTGMERDESSDAGFGLVTNMSLAEGTSNRIQCSTEQEPSCGTRIGTRDLGHRCGTCKKTFAELQELKEHTCVNVRDRHSCYMCSKSYTNRGNLNRHYRVHYGEHSRLDSGERPHCCGICNKAFKHIYTLKRHTRLHTCDGRTSVAFATRDSLKEVT